MASDSEEDGGIHALFEDEDEQPWGSVRDADLSHVAPRPPALPADTRPAVGIEGAHRMASIRATAGAAACKDNVTAQEKARGLMHWADMQGAVLHKVAVAPSPLGGLGMVAVEEIRPGDLLVRIPRRVAITQHRCHDPETAIGAILLAHDVPAFTSLAAFLLAQTEDAESFYAPYLPTLPGHGEIHNAPYFEASEVEALEGSWKEKACSIRARVSGALSYFQTELQALYPDAFPHKASGEKANIDDEGPYAESHVKWMLSVVISRTFDINGRMVILPVIDAFNHDPVLGGRLCWNAEGEFEVHAEMPASVGEEVFLCYGPPDKMGNDNLHATYGFVLPELDAC